MTKTIPTVRKTVRNWPVAATPPRGTPSSRMPTNVNIATADRCDMYVCVCAHVSTYFSGLLPPLRLIASARACLILQCKYVDTIKLYIDFYITIIIILTVVIQFYYIIITLNDNEDYKL